MTPPTVASGCGYYEGIRLECSSWKSKATSDTATARYLKTPNGGVGGVGELLLRQVAQPTLVTGDPAGQETLVTGPVCDGIGRRSR